MGNEPSSGATLTTKREFDLGDILEDFFGKGHPLTHIAARIREENPEGPTLDMNGRPKNVDDEN